MISYIGAIVLGLFWIAMTGSASIPNIAFGFALGLFCLYIVREEVRSSITTVRFGKIILLALVFGKELVLSAWRVALLVTRPKMDFIPGVFAYPLTVDRDFEIMLLANMITLTPGTLSIDVSSDRKHLFVHAIDCSDVDQAIRDIERSFERRIVEAFR